MKIPFATLLLSLLMAASASAQQSRVAILGLSTADGDDDVAAGLSDAVREVAVSVEGWDVKSSAVSSEQMSMVHDCEVTQDACMAKIVSALEVDIVVYGNIRRQGSGKDAPILAQMRMFDREQGGVSKSARAEMAAESVGLDNLLGHADDLIRQLTGAAEKAAAQSAPPPPVEDPVEEEDALSFEADSSDGDPLMEYLPYALIGVAGLSAGLAVFSWAQIDSASEDPSFKSYRRAIGNQPNAAGVSDVCEEADKGNDFGLDPGTFSAAQDACSQGQTFEVLQWVFIGTALVSGGVGAYMLIDGAGDEQASLGDTRIALRPHVGPHNTGFSVRLDF